MTGSAEPQTKKYFLCLFQVWQDQVRLEKPQRNKATQVQSIEPTRRGLQISFWCNPVFGNWRTNNPAHPYFFFKNNGGTFLLSSNFAKHRIASSFIFIKNKAEGLVVKRQVGVKAWFNGRKKVLIQFRKLCTLPGPVLSKERYLEFYYLP